MQNEDDLRGLAKVMDFMRAISILFVVINIYWFCYQSFREWGINIGVVDKILLNFQRTAGLFSNILYTKLFSVVFLALSCLGTKGVKEEKITWNKIYVFLTIGFILFFLNWWLLVLPLPLAANTALYIFTMTAGYLSLLAAGVWISRLLKNNLMDDVFNLENESFAQETRLIENEYSINLPTRFYYKKKWNDGWINIVNPFRASMVLGTPGSGKSYAIVNNYIKGEERSFTIIAYPIPEIGNDYEKIFDETVKINTLDYDVYCKIQKNIIDALDKADYVEVKGMNGNKTDICVNLMKKTNAEKQTVFENCLADVNIPLGEVFTSPVLAKTNGVINVSEVYLNDLKFKNLSVTLKDGMVADYTCDNFADEEKNREFFKENVLYNHETLPIGEFAIGTNTTAYVMANKYDIVYKLPILIVEKMGPHFALGDTCYSRAEDIKVYNPDGKEIISKENEISSLRKTQPEKAYFNCHTDITIPYEEIGSITAVEIDGKRTDIIRNGRFVLEGCEELNRPFEK